MSEKREKEKILIKMPHLILCEGKDEYKFLISYLNSDALKDIPFCSEMIQVIDFGGNEDLPTFLKALLVSPSAKLIRSILVVRDAELNAKKAECDVKKALRDNKLPVPEKSGDWTDGSLKTSYLLFPSFDGSHGTLEDLALDILDKSQAGNVPDEINSFLFSLEEKGHRTFSHRHKAKLHTYFSVTDRYVTMKLGEAASAGAFNWSHPRLEPLRNCLRKME